MFASNVREAARANVLPRLGASALGNSLVYNLPHSDVQVSGINYQAYAFDGTNGSPSSEADVQSDIARGSTSALTEFGAAQGQKIVFGVAPDRPGPSFQPTFCHKPCSAGSHGRRGVSCSENW